MRILICGDVIGRNGRDTINKYIPDLKKRLSIDFILLNVDNAAGGFGITSEIANSFFKLGADVLTGGNHIFDQSGVAAFLESEKRMLRPHNMPTNVPGRGVSETITDSGKKVIVIHLLGQRNMPLIGNDPFECSNNLLSKYKLGENADAIVVDFHAEITSEKNALGHFLDGRVSVVFGTHTHIPTSDDRILEHGTAFQTDVGMCGDFDSVIGMKKEIVVEKFSKIQTKVKFTGATGEATLCGLLVDTDDKTGLANSVKPIRLGGLLTQTII
ncbi:MAG: TIGR00282 family metallophosphoesterase [Holosporaceae bacterium]|jgi:metallophosphoesterase (TIGR00282 family)|nr:TIGR00282 family metallophosphoesterase [Holosporaceae bacterium]